MIRTLALLLALVWVISGIAGSTPAPVHVFEPGEMDFSRANSALTISSFSPERTVISLMTPEVVMFDTMLDYETYQVFGISGEPLLLEEGVPSVPQITRLYRIPNTGSVELIFGDLAFHVVDNVNAMPVQWDKPGFSGRPARRGDIYGADEWFPASVAEMSEPMILRDFRVVSVTLYPVQINPVTGQARVYDQLSVDVVANNAPGTNEILHARRPSAAFAPIYRDMIRNLDDNALDDVMETPGSMIILCRDLPVVRQWADSLALWKKRRGMNVAVDSRNSWTTSSMVAAIQNAYQTWDPPLEYACIVGDVTGSYAMPTDASAYDHVFALMNNDDLEDIGIGRLSAQTETHLMTIHAKIMAYERTPYMTDTGWFKRAFFYAGTAANCRSNPLAMLWAREQFEHYTGVNDTIYVDTTPGSVNPTTISTRFNQGISYFLWRGTVVGEMNTGHASVMNASFRLPVTLTITCGSGDYNLSSESITEAWLLAGTPTQPKGGVCGIGTATWNTHIPYNNTMAGGLAYSIANLRIENLGVASASAKAQLHAAFPNNSQAVNFSRWNNLMGDPSLSMWTDEPVVMNVTHAGTVNVGARRIRPQVTSQATGLPIADALVVLWKGDETYTMGRTDAGGFVDVPVTVNTPGTLLLTVTKQNHKPYLADITCVPAARMVSLSSYTVDDDNVGGTSGNQDGNLNPGEVIDLRAALRNFGSSLEATGVTASLSSDNGLVTVVNGTATFTDIAPGDSAIAAAPFRIAVSPLMVRHDRAIMTLEVTASGDITYSSFELRCRAGEPVWIASQVTGGDGDAWLEPDETVNLALTIRNQGDIPLPGVAATLVSNSSFVAVTQNQGTFGTIAVGQNASNGSSPFEVRANTLVYRGHQASMMLLLSMTGGLVDTVTFNLPVGVAAATDPTGPDAYGYYAYEDIDDSIEFHNEFQYVDISAIGTNLNLNDPGEQPSSVPPVFSTARPLPFPFRFYGQDYTVITICSNGWAAFGDQSFLDLFRNYPIPGQQAPDAMLAVFWDDLRTSGSGLGVWAYADNANHRYIIQWKATGWAGGEGSIQENFEIILLDPQYYPTRSGDGIIIYQYQTITELQGDFVGGAPDVRYSTIGIQAPGSTMGLQYRFNNVASPGGGSLVNGRAVTFTTESRAAFGAISGSVVDAATNEPMFGVLVSVDGHNDMAVTDVNGDYTIEDVLIGTYSVRAQYFGFNDGVAENVVIEMDSTRTLNYSLTHPEITLSRDSVIVYLPTDPVETSFRITNDGNGPLDYNIAIRYDAGSTPADAWDYLTGIDDPVLLADGMIQGCEFVGDYWWVTGGGGPGGQNMFYRFDLEGDYVDAIPQPTSSDFGWYDMAWDGTYLYGSEDRASGGQIKGIDQSGQVQATITSPVNPTRAIAYDPQADRFWVADLTSDIYEISRNGTIHRQFATPQHVTGLAWNPSDPDGYKLYVFHKDANLQHARVTRVHPVTGDRQFIVQLGTRPGDYAGGCTVTGAWNSTLLVFGGILQNPSGDHLGIWELTFNTTWVTVTPMIASVPAHSWRDVTIVFDPSQLRNYVYRVNLFIDNNSADSMRVLPVELTVAVAADDVPAELPTVYALMQNYPNPFNGATTLRFDLKQAGFTTLKVYNVLGQEVVSVLNRTMEAGRHTVNFDMSHLPSGVYVYRIESGRFADARKLVLLK